MRVAMLSVGIVFVHVHNNPYPYILGALGLGALLGKFAPASGKSLNGGK